MLSFFGYEDQVFNLLTQLNKNSYAYLNLHKIQIRGFVVKFKPETNQAIEFGEECNDWEFICPEEE